MNSEYKAFIALVAIAGVVITALLLPPVQSEDIFIVRGSGGNVSGAVSSVNAGSGISVNQTTGNIMINNTSPDNTSCTNVGTGSQVYKDGECNFRTVIGSNDISVTQQTNTITIDYNGSSGVTSVGSTSPIVSSGGSTPNISCPTCIESNESWVIIANVSAPNANTTLQTGSIAGYKYYHIQIELITQTSASTWGMQFNRDTANNYAYRYSSNFGGSTTATLQNNMNFIENIGSGVVLINIFCQQTTNTAFQKLCVVELVENDSPPNTIELFGVWGKTELIDNVRIVRTAGTGTMQTTSNMVVLGHN